SGLQVERILADPSFRPVYVGGLAQEPSLLWYLMAGSFHIFGSTQLALRIPSAIGGIVGVPAIYLLGRELFGHRVGLIAAGLLTGLVWHVTFSRLAFNSVWSVSLDALGLFLIVRALKTGSWTAAALGGISFGLGLHMYYTSRVMVIVAGCALLAFWLVRPRERLQPTWRVMAIAACAGLITAAPLVEYAVMQPSEFNSRLTQASVLTESSDRPTDARVLDNLKAHLLMFNLAGDRNARHNLPGEPELNFLLGGLLVLGLALSLARFRRPEYALLPIWAVLMLAGGVLSLNFEAPQSLRTIDETNVVVLLCAIPLAQLWRASAALGPRIPTLGAVLPSRVAVAGPSVFRAPTSPSVSSPVVATRGVAWLTAHLTLALLPVWLAAALWITQPVYHTLLTSMPGGFDAAQFAWGFWWVKFALLTLHQSPLYTSYEFAPQQVNLAFHTLVLLPALISIPLQSALGLFGAINVVLLASLVAMSACTFLLVHQETGSRAGAFVGSLIFTYAPYRLAHLGAAHLDVVMAWPVPLFAFFLLRWLRGARVVHAVAAGAALAAVGLTDLSQFALCLVFAALVVVGFTWRWLPDWRAADHHHVRLRSELLGIGAIGLTSALLLGPQLAALLDGLLHGWSTDIAIGAADGWAPDLLSYFTPLPNSRLLGSLGTAVAQNFKFLDPPRLVFLGYVTLALAIAALWARRRANVRCWWLIVAAFWLLSLGPHLHVAGQTQFSIGGAQFQVPLPFLLYHALPLLGGLSIPGYASVFVMLGLAVLAGHGIAALSTRTGHAAALAAGLGLLVVAEFSVTPIGMFGPQPNPVYARIGAEPGSQAVLVTPAGWSTELGGLEGFDQAEMYYATFTQKPMVSGYVSRAPKTLFSYYEGEPALSVLLFPDRPPTPDSSDPRQVAAALDRLGVGYVVLHHSAAFGQQLEYLTTTLNYPVFYQDADVVAFKVPQ
ncbi:MAG: glycosyltransferase family 39 protein, partial [Chloroflexi bacterium]|nr:glycosyltransferase family 39 protein [Chloroflexota bacterium]